MGELGKLRLYGVALADDLEIKLSLTRIEDTRSFEAQLLFYEDGEEVMNLELDACVTLGQVSKWALPAEFIFEYDDIEKLVEILAANALEKCEIHKGGDNTVEFILHFTEDENNLGATIGAAMLEPYITLL